MSEEQRMQKFKVLIEYSDEFGNEFKGLSESNLISNIEFNVDAVIRHIERAFEALGFSTEYIKNYYLQRIKNEKSQSK